MAERNALPGTTVVRWSERPDMESFMRSVVPGHTESEIREAFRDRFGVTLTDGQIGNFKSARGLRSGTHGGWFKKGAAPHNKGRAQREWMGDDAMERTMATRFRTGHVSERWAGVPVGAERTNRDGLVEVKVDERPTPGTKDNWVPKHRLVWELSHGRPVPPGHKVIFCDGDRGNLDPSNLLLVSCSELMRMNRGPGWSDRVTAEAALSVARLEAAISERRGHGEG